MPKPRPHWWEVNDPIGRLVCHKADFFPVMVVKAVRPCFGLYGQRDLAECVWWDAYRDGYVSQEYYIDTLMVLA